MDSLPKAISVVIQRLEENRQDLTTWILYIKLFFSLAIDFRTVTFILTQRGIYRGNHFRCSDSVCRKACRIKEMDSFVVASDWMFAKTSFEVFR